MDILIHILASITLLTTSLFGGSGDTFAAQEVVDNSQNQTVEVGIRELSPKGEAGGFAMPASGCGVISHGPQHDCQAGLPEISVNLTIVRKNDPVIITWDPGFNTGCVLTGNLTDLGPTIIQGNNPPNANVYDSAEDNPTGETTYGIICDGQGQEAYVSVQVLPEIQET